ncbi:MAG: D-tyrosyl-tRNA(Tyr) deacylase [Oscillospiraceae bacterium]|nr:D-tyrosyl-tRNA(Tyr) deacylase [Oscillospiraceae bacterium]
MRAVVTRVAEASVTVGGAVVGAIGCGYLILLGVGPEDTEETARKLAVRICNTRVFEDPDGKMNLSLSQIGGSILAVSQFTLYADLKSRRPGFSHAAPPALAEHLYETFKDQCRELGFPVQAGVFGADMQVSSVNDGPVTLIFDTDRA